MKCVICKRNDKRKPRTFKAARALVRKHEVAIRMHAIRALVALWGSPLTLTGKGKGK